MLEFVAGTIVEPTTQKLTMFQHVLELRISYIFDSHCHHLNVVVRCRLERLQRYHGIHLLVRSDVIF